MRIQLHWQGFWAALGRCLQGLWIRIRINWQDSSGASRLEWEKALPIKNAKPLALSRSNNLKLSKKFVWSSWQWGRYKRTQRGWTNSSALSGCLKAAGNSSFLLKTELIHTITIKEKRRTPHPQSLSEQFVHYFVLPQLFWIWKQEREKSGYLSVKHPSSNLMVFVSGFPKVTGNRLRSFYQLDQLKHSVRHWQCNSPVPTLS